MKIKFALLISATLSSLALLPRTGTAGDLADKNKVTVDAPGPFDRGGFEFLGGAGAFYSISTTSAKRPTINDQETDLKLGWMYDSPRHHGLLRGNNEFLLEAFGGPITKGGGHFLAGAALLWRYNFIQENAHLIPYFQLGAGALGDNVYRDHAQSEIGGAFEFDLQGGAGLRYLINDRWAVSSEFDFRHISNAGIYPRNEGLNSLGGLLQISYFFR